MRTASLLSLLALPILVAGCADTASSSGISTSDIEAKIVIDVWTADNGAVAGDTRPGTYIQTTLRRSADYVELADGDGLVASTDKDTALPMARQKLVDEVFYVARIPELDRKSVNVALTRKDGTSAPASKMDLPAALAFTPPAPTTLAHGDTLKLAWPNKIDGAKIMYRTFECGTTGTTEFDSTGKDDTGSYELTGKELFGDTAPTAPACLMLFVQRQVKGGTLDPAFGNAKDNKTAITANRYEAIKLTITP